MALLALGHASGVAPLPFLPAGPASQTDSACCLTPDPVAHAPCDQSLAAPLQSLGRYAAANAPLVCGPIAARRLPLDDPLRHPRRQTLLAYIGEAPGATFREVIRETGIPAGTARHHLTVLCRNGVIIEKRHRCTLRFFENHGLYDRNWRAIVLLREEPLATLHGWLHDNPDSMQDRVLKAMESQEGWSRSTTQNRLERLVREGLVTMRPQGRLKLYRVRKEPLVPPCPHGCPPSP